VVTATDETLAAEFAAHRGHLLGVAYRLTGAFADAEDAVQESWLRLAALPAATRAGIVELRAWLTTVVSRICLDRLRSAAARRERYVGPWLPEPAITELSGGRPVDPAEAALQAEDVRLAALVVLDRLTPQQRVAFVLHDTLALSFTEIAEVLGCTVPTARQHAARGRRALAEADPPTRPDLAEQERVVGAFLAALANGDVPAVVAALHPDVVVVGDGGGQVSSARRPIVGVDKAARFALGLFARYGLALPGSSRFVLVNGDLGLAVVSPAAGSGLVRRVTTFAVRDGRIAAVYDIANPAKLGRLPLA
jgi:RNA polymerase sigma-70 factor (ECF subfamily)